MSLMPSLCAALERAGGDRLVMKAGERPHVLAGDRRHDVASAVLSVHALEALSEQILSAAARQDLASSGAASETVYTPSYPRPLVARAERVGSEFCIELIVEAQPADMETVAPPAEPVAATSAEVEHTALPTTYSHIAEPEAAYDAPAAYAAPTEPEPVADPVTPVPTPEPPRTPEPAGEFMHRDHTVSAQRPEMAVVARVQDAHRPVRPNAPLDLLSWIARAADLGATTLYLRAASPASARIDDRIQPLGRDVVDAALIEETAATFTRGGEGMWEPRADGEWVREDENVGYVSCRVFSDLQGTGLIIQLRPSRSLRLLHKYIPRQVRVACEGDGVVVVAAPSETDVETLAAAVADRTGRDRGGYLISLQRRNGHRSEITGAFVSQRSVAGGEKEFATAIKRAAQEGPDILLVTGLQSLQSVQAAVLAATGGRLVIVGVVAPTTIEALRVLAGSDPHVRRALAGSFRAAIGYRSLRRVGGGRALVQDIILPTSTVCGLLEAGDFDGLARIQRDGASGMKSVDDSLARAVHRRQVSLREAAGQAVDRSRLVALVRTRARTSVRSHSSPRGSAVTWATGTHA